MSWTEIGKPSKLTVWVRVICPGNRLLIRSGPSVQEESVGWVNSGDEIEVFSRTVSGFFKLADGRVSDLSRPFTWRC